MPEFLMVCQVNLSFLLVNFVQNCSYLRRPVMGKPNKILEVTFSFSLSIIELHKMLTDKKDFVISRQLLRSATSIGANAEEANAAQTRKDFITKMAIASKEARETKYWLRLLAASKILEIDYGVYLRTIDDIINIVTKIVKTAQESLKTENEELLKPSD